MSRKESLIGGVIATILATACCWLPAVAMTFGGATILIGLREHLEIYIAGFMTIGFGVLGFTVYQIYRKRKWQMMTQKITHISIIACPECGHKSEEKMPTNACQYFYDCDNCHAILKPLEGDCCVYCSYGTVACPPIQSNQPCC